MDDDSAIENATGSGYTVTGSKDGDKGKEKRMPEWLESTVGGKRAPRGLIAAGGSAAGWGGGNSGAAASRSDATDTCAGGLHNTGLHDVASSDAVTEELSEPCTCTDDPCSCDDIHTDTGVSGGGGGAAGAAAGSSFTVGLAVASGGVVAGTPSFGKHGAGSAADTASTGTVIADVASAGGAGGVAGHAGGAESAGGAAGAGDAVGAAVGTAFGGTATCLNPTAAGVDDGGGVGGAGGGVESAGGAAGTYDAVGAAVGAAGTYDAGGAAGTYDAVGAAVGAAVGSATPPSAVVPGTSVPSAAAGAGAGDGSGVATAGGAVGAGGGVAAHTPDTTASTAPGSDVVIFCTRCVNARFTSIAAYVQHSGSLHSVTCWELQRLPDDRKTITLAEPAPAPFAGVFQCPRCPKRLRSKAGFLSHAFNLHQVPYDSPDMHMLVEDAKKFSTV